MKPMSQHLDQMASHYKVIVIGSGYGGGVAASRLASCGQSVCVLERGREFLPGEFPDRLGEGMAQVQINSPTSHFGSNTGLFDFHTGDDIHVLVGCGLGGTSLINANVSLKADSRVFDDAQWPTELTNCPDLAQGYHRAQQMLRPQPVPDKIAKKLRKLDAMKKSAELLGTTCVTPPINVTFTSGPNAANVTQPACTLCGDCCSGCNAGAKNTVQMTYLPDAVNHGAEIFTEVTVRYLRPENDIWRVFYEPSSKDDDYFDAPERSLTADIVVIAAGTLGSTEILLRSREKGMNLSDQLGQKFTGNGDVLAFAYNNDVPINGIGVGVPPKVEAEPPEVGPCITGAIDLRESDDLKDGMIIEEGVIPGLLSPILPALLAGGGLVGEDTDFGLGDKLGESARTGKSLLGGSYTGAVHNSQTFLVMSHDDGNGKIVLNGNTVNVSWPGVANQSNFSRVNEKLKQATAATGGTYVKNPISQKLLGENIVTVHPLGGCPMGRSAKTAVVNHKCQVFDAKANNSESAHENLYVCDGSIIPRPLGVNPLLTITALAERAMIHVAKDNNWRFDSAPKTDAPLRDASPQASERDQVVGVEFTERMTGFWSSTVLDDFEAALQDGKNANQSLSFILNVVAENIDRFVKDQDHTARMSGTVTSDALSSETLDVSSGRFNLFAPDDSAVDQRRMDYSMIITGRDGKRYRFEGHKIIHDDPGIDLWSDTTRLFFDLYDLDDNAHIGRGILSIAIGDLLTQLRTLHGRGGKNALERANALLKFATLFGETLYTTYAGIVAPLHRFDEGQKRKKRELRVAEPEVHWFNTADGLKLRLTRYKGGNKGPVIFSHGLGVSSKIFSIDTINTNLLEYIHAAGYDCWLLDYRASTDLSYATQQWSADDVSKYDYPAAIEKVRAITGAKNLQFIVHCFGATTFVMSMLSGLSHVRSILISQIAIDVLGPWWPQRLLAHLRLPSLMKLMGIKSVDAKATTKVAWWQKAADRAIRIVLPLQSGERSQSATSNRITMLYGSLYQHAQLNRMTYLDGLPEMFGKANIRAFRQLAAIARKTHIIDAAGKDSYRPHLDRLKLPICFIHGAENKCFIPESTKRTFEGLVKKHGHELYERHVISGYGHIDCIFGKNAADDVFPHILQHLEKNAKETT